MHHAYSGGYEIGDICGGFDVIGEAPLTHATSPTSEGGGSTADAMLEEETRPQIFEDTSGEPDGGGGILDQFMQAANGITGGILGAAAGILPGFAQSSTDQVAFVVVTVKDVQHALNVLGFGPLGEDGLLGPMTKAATQTYQRSRGLNPDGIAGPATKDRLTKDLAARAAGSGPGGLLSKLPTIFGPAGGGIIPTPFGNLPNPFGGPTPAPPPRPPTPIAPARPADSGILGIPTPVFIGGALVGVGVLVAAGFVFGGGRKKKGKR